MATECKPIDLICEFKQNPLGIDELNPRLSWKLQDSRPGAGQKSYQLQAASTQALLNYKPDLWDTHQVKDSQSLDIEYNGKKLTSRKRVWWRVRVWDLHGSPSAWSEPAFFEMGLLKKNDWQAQWIHRPANNKEAGQPSPYFRKLFTLPAPVVSARLYVSAQGLFETYCNGVRIGNDFFAPGWTDYRKRIQYLAYDITHLLKQGENAIGAILGDGWFAGHMTWSKERCYYGQQLALLVQLEVACSDGSNHCFGSGPDWKTSLGPILSSDIYDGETYDARLELGDWSNAAYHDATWAAAVTLAAPKAQIVSMPNLSVRKQEERTPVAQTQPQPGVHIFDLGQNMVGWARIRLHNQPVGKRIQLRFAEMLKDDGTMYVENLRKAKATDTYICKGWNEEVWEPRFTYHGFRYIEVSGTSGAPHANDIAGIVLHSEIKQTGTFECSDPLVNQLQSNITWGQRGNFLELPTDCPQRDERLGWTGDAQVFIRTACFNRDVATFFEKWCLDLSDAQYKDGQVPHVVPDVLGNWKGSAAAWADAAVICPWTVYLCYGDKRILERQYDSMCKWVNWRAKTSRNGIHDSACFGDWLAIDMAEGDCSRTPTPRDLIATAYFARTTQILASSAGLIGKKADAKKYGSLHKKIITAFNREFVSSTGRLAGDSQTGYLLALGFDLLPASKRAYALERLVQDIKNRNYHLSTGFVGTPLLTPVLSAMGKNDVAYKLLLQQTYPSWIYPILQGATTMWERWNSYTKDKGFGDVGMNSFNHYAYGAIGEWLYNTVAGIDLDPKNPGYKHIIFRPTPGEGISRAKAELKTRYGKAACEWKIEGKRMSGTISVPPNTSATLLLPGQKAQKTGAGRHAFSVAYKAPKP